MIKDLGLAGIYLFTLITTIFFGSLTLNREFESRTYDQLSIRPVSSHIFILGKFIGLFMAMALNIIVLYLIYLIVILAKGGGFDALSLIQTLFLFEEITIVISLNFLISTRFPHLGTITLGAIMVVLGHSTILFKTVGIGFTKFIGLLVYYLLPNLEKFNYRNSIVYGQHPGFENLLLAAFYALAYSAILLILTTEIIKKRTR